MANNGNTKKKTQAAVNRYEAFRLKLAGASYRQIGEALGVSGKTAFKYVQRVLKEMAPPVEDVTYHRNMEVARLEEMILGIYKRAKSGDYQAIDRVDRLGRRITELNGAEPKHNIDLPGGATGMNVSVQFIKSEIDNADNEN